GGGGGKRPLQQRRGGHAVRRCRRPEARGAGRGDRGAPSRRERRATAGLDLRTGSLSAQALAAALSAAVPEVAPCPFGRVLPWAKRTVRTDLFDFDLPPERIALRPVSPRDASRLLVVRCGGGPELDDRAMRDLPELPRARR